jgi:hypothetical protein
MSYLWPAGQPIKWWRWQVRSVDHIARKLFVTVVKFCSKHVIVNGKPFQMKGVFLAYFLSKRIYAILPEPPSGRTECQSFSSVSCFRWSDTTSRVHSVLLSCGSSCSGGSLEGLYESLLTELWRAAKPLCQCRNFRFLSPVSVKCRRTSWIHWRYETYELNVKGTLTLWLQIAHSRHAAHRVEFTQIIVIWPPNIA